MNVLQKKYFAELLGTMLLVFLGCGTALFTNVDIVATALAFGLETKCKCSGNDINICEQRCATAEEYEQHSAKQLGEILLL